LWVGPSSLLWSQDAAVPTQTSGLEGSTKNLALCAVGSLQDSTLWLQVCAVSLTTACFPRFRALGRWAE
jgi:hypothetical protein